MQLQLPLLLRQKQRKKRRHVIQNSKRHHSFRKTKSSDFGNPTNRTNNFFTTHKIHPIRLSNRNNNKRLQLTFIPPKTPKTTQHPLTNKLRRHLARQIQIKRKSLNFLNSRKKHTSSKRLRHPIQHSLHSPRRRSRTPIRKLLILIKLNTSNLIQLRLDIRIRNKRKTLKNPKRTINKNPKNSKSLTFSIQQNLSITKIKQKNQRHVRSRQLSLHRLRRTLIPLLPLLNMETNELQLRNNLLNSTKTPTKTILPYGRMQNLQKRLMWLMLHLKLRNNRQSIQTSKHTLQTLHNPN